MLIQCNVERGAGERVATVSLDRFVYKFEPRPDLTGNDTDMVAEVNSGSHQEYLLNQNGDFCEWVVHKEGIDGTDKKEPQRRRRKG